MLPLVTRFKMIELDVAVLRGMQAIMGKHGAGCGGVNELKQPDL